MACIKRLLCCGKNGRAPRHEKKTWQLAIAGWKLKDVSPEETPDLEHIAWDDPRFITALKSYLETQFGDLLEIRLSDQSSSV